MANIPSANGALPGVFTNVITQSNNSSVPGGIRVAAIIGQGARSETIVASANGGGNDGLNPTYTGTQGADGRHFLLDFFPVISNRTQLFKNGIPLIGLEEPIPASGIFGDQYDYVLDITTGEIELQQGFLVDQGGSYFLAAETNVGLGSLTSLALVDADAPTETWTIKCVSVQRNNLNQPIAGTASFVAFGSVSGNVVDQYGNTVVWVSNGTVASNSILSFGIVETNFVPGNPPTSTSPFRQGDYFTVKVSSGVLVRGDSLTASYIAVSDINNPTFLSSTSQIQTNYGNVSLSNTLSLGCQLAFANQTPGIMCVEAAPPLPRRVSYELETNFNATSADCNDFIIPLPLGVSPDPNSQIHIFVTNPTTGIETQLLPNMFPFYTLGTAGKPTTCAFVFDNTQLPGGNSFSYSVNQENAVLNFAQDGYLNASLTSPIHATFSSASVTFEQSNIGETLNIIDSANPANVGEFTITAVSGGVATISALATPSFQDFVDIGTTTIAIGSDAQTLPQAIINVATTVSLFSSTGGTAYVTTSAGVQTVLYTGTSGGNQLTGCTGGTGTMSTGGVVGPASFQLINSLFGTPVPGAAGILSISPVGGTGTAIVATSIDLTSYFVPGYMFLIKYPNSPLDGNNNPLDSGLFDTLSMFSGTSFTITKSFVSEHNLKFEVVDTTQTSNFLILNHNIVPNGNNLRVTIVDVKDAAFFDAGWELALASLETQEIDILVTLPLQTITVIFQNALNHCLEMSNILNRKERVLFLGAINGLTPANLTGQSLAAVESLGILEGIQGNTVAEILAGDTEDLANYSVPAAYGETYRAVYFFPDQIVVQVGTNNQIIDGFYIAAAAAGYESGQANVAQPLTNKNLGGFTILNNRTFNNTTLMQLAAAGVTSLTPIAGGGNVVWGLTTTQSGFPQEQEISIIFIRDRIAKSLRTGFSGFIGNPENADTAGVLMARAVALFNSFIQAGLILSWTGLTVAQDLVDPRQWNISAVVTAVEPINWIYITVGVS